MFLSYNLVYGCILVFIDQLTHKASVKYNIVLSLQVYPNDIMK